jgi:hypothetical protein
VLRNLSSAPKITLANESGQCRSTSALPHRASCCAGTSTVTGADLNALTCTTWHLAAAQAATNVVGNLTWVRSKRSSCRGMATRLTTASCPASSAVIRRRHARSPPAFSMGNICNVARCGLRRVGTVIAALQLGQHTRPTNRMPPGKRELFSCAGCLVKISDSS